MSGKADVGLIGLAVMGENLVLNIESRGFTVAVFNRTVSKVDDFISNRAKGKNIIGTHSIEEFVSVIKRPRKIILLVKAGQPVDDMIQQLLPHLEEGDIIFDGGNSFFKDTERREAELAKRGIHFIGSGISGGEEGALRGPSIMPGGPKEAYDAFEPILTKIAAKTEDGPCVTYVGPRGAGHFVKMVHNGIEYGDMELIAETYNMLKNLGGFSPNEMADIFNRWNEGVLSSYLIEITGRVLSYNDPETGKPLVELILDTAGQKGTGRWTSQTALEFGVPIPTIDAAVFARTISSYKEARVRASKILTGPSPKKVSNTEELLDLIHDALYASKIISYAQGFALIRTVSKELGYNINYAELARIWKGGCIIRAQLLDKIKQAFIENPDLENLLLYPYFTEIVKKAESKCRKLICIAKENGLPIPAFSNSLDYYDAYRAERLPANLIQAQRDYFGAHTYQRIDKEGIFHTDWMSIFGETKR